MNDLPVNESSEHPNESAAAERETTDSSAPVEMLRGWREASAVRFRIAGFIAAAFAAAFLIADDRWSWLDYQPGGTAFFTYVRPVSIGLLVLGALIAIRWELPGGVVAGFAAGAIVAIAVNQLTGRSTLLVATLLAIPTVLWALSDLVGWSTRRAALGLAVAVVATAGGALAGETVYERAFGPTHPQSDRPALADTPVRWAWSGGVTSTHAEIRARLDDESVPDDQLRLAVSTTGSFDDADYAELESRDGPLLTFDLDGLSPDTPHRYAVEVAGVLDEARAGEFTTFPDEAASFRFTVGACARVGSNGEVFETIADEDPLFHLITGDFHYGDIPDDDRARYDEVIDLTLRQSAQAHLYSSAPIAYVWDDHDYGVDNSDMLSTSRLAAMQAYRSNVPSYALASDVSAIYQKFDVGRVRFLVTDTRSARDPGVSMLGPAQLEWFLDQLVVGAEEQALVVWVNPVPWVAEASEGADNWAGYDAERRQIAEVIAANDIDNLMMVSGDAHMVAIDDGTNTDYSASGNAGFPLIHAAALDRPGSFKGGPYSEGANPGTGQYGVVDVTDDGTTISVSMRAKRYTGEVLLSYDFVVPTN